MNNTTYSPEDLRGMLDTYSPEQQMEINAKIISESAKTLADASAQIKECMTNFPSIITAMQKATTLHISEESKAEIIQAGKDVGIAVSKVFNESVSETIAKAQKEVKRVSIPAAMAYCLFYVFIVLITYAAVMLFVNGFVWHNEFIWKLALILLGFMTSVTTLTILICYKGWL
jgi:hypothetical protein